LLAESLAALSLVVPVLLLIVLLEGNVEAAEKRPFTVTDMIEMTEIFDPSPLSRSGQVPHFAFSPDGESFAVVLRRGIIATNSIDYSLHVFETEDVASFVNTPGEAKLPESKVVSKWTTSGSRPGIEQVRWRGRDEVSFIGRSNDQSAGIYSINTKSGRLTPIIKKSADIYAYAASGDTILYSSATQTDWNERNQKGYVIRGQMIHDLTIDDPRLRPYQTAAIFVKKGDGREYKLDLPEDYQSLQIGTLPGAGDLFISPDGEWAVVVAAARNIADGWEGYAYLKRYVEQVESQLGPQVVGTKGILDSLVSDKEYARRSSWLKQFYLVNVKTGATKPLVNAPTGYTGGRVHVLWAKDGKSVVVTPTYLPLDGASEHERARRSDEQSVVQVDLATGEAVRVTGRRVKSLIDLTWQSDGAICGAWDDPSMGVEQKECYARKVDAWASIEAAPNERKDGHAIAIDVVEDMNTPPELRAMDEATGRAKVITRLNPQLDLMTLGREEAFTWKDRYQRSFTGGVVFPPDYKSGSRYPVVLQVNDFNASEFLVDGGRGMSSAYAARPLANKGILVLQLPAIPISLPPVSRNFDWKVDSENQRFVAMIEGAIDALDAAGMIDRNRVGLIGFSRGGMNVLHAVTFSKYPIAAATIAHGIQPTPMGYSMLGGLPFPLGMYAFEDPEIIGAPFWGDGIKVWLERSPAFHLDQVKAAIRFEHISNSVPEYWDTFVNLKRNQRPVEMVHIPWAVHQLEPPLARYTSQQGNVDWYAYWLKGEEDPDPRKKEQYERWGRLRRQKEALSPTVSPGSMTDAPIKVGGQKNETSHVSAH